MRLLMMVATVWYDRSALYARHAHFSTYERPRDEMHSRDLREDGK